MASLADALPFVLRHEGGFSDDPDDRGGATNHGITEEVARLNGYTGDMRALPMDVVGYIYRKDYWRFDAITDQRVATKVFDLCVNFGLSGGVRLLQRALNISGGLVTTDGVCGPATLAATNQADPSTLLDALAMEATVRYHEIVAARPDQRKFLAGWLHRAGDLP